MKSDGGEDLDTEENTSRADNREARTLEEINAAIRDQMVQQITEQTRNTSTVRPSIGLIIVEELEESVNVSEVENVLKVLHLRRTDSIEKQKKNSCRDVINGDEEKRQRKYLQCSKIQNIERQMVWTHKQNCSRK